MLSPKTEARAVPMAALALLDGSEEAADEAAVEAVEAAVSVVTPWHSVPTEVTTVVPAAILKAGISKAKTPPNAAAGAKSAGKKQRKA